MKRRNFISAKSLILQYSKKYNQPVPKLMKLVYEPKTKKFNAEYKYENQTTNDISVFDNDDNWFEELQNSVRN